jgi:hypothetical protein
MITPIYIYIYNGFFHICSVRKKLKFMFLECKDLDLDFPAIKLVARVKKYCRKMTSCLLLKKKTQVHEPNLLVPSLPRLYKF